MNRKLNYLFIFITILLSLKLFEPKFINEDLIKYSNFLIYVLVLIFSLPYMFKKFEGFIIPIYLFIFSVVISILMSNIFWDQNFKDSIIETAPYLVWLFFFYLLYSDLLIADLEKIIIAFGLLYFSLYFFQYFNSSVVYFGKPLSGEEFLETRGVTRIIFPGGGVFILFVFLSINRLTGRAKIKLFWLIISLLGILITVLQATRQFIVGVILIYLFHLFKNLNPFQRIFVIFSSIILLVAVFYFSPEIFSELLSKSNEDLRLGDDYIRVKAGKFFLTDFSPHFLAYIFGNGVPAWSASNYGYLMEMLAFHQDFYLSDIGLIAVQVMFGIPAVIAYIMIWIKSFSMPLPKEYYYLKYYLWFLLLTSLTWYTVYHFHYLIVTVLVLFMYQKIWSNYKSAGSLNFSVDGK